MEPFHGDQRIGRPHLVAYLSSLTEMELSAYCSGVLAQYGAFDRAVGDDIVPEGYDASFAGTRYHRGPTEVPEIGDGERWCVRCHKVKKVHTFDGDASRCRLCDAVTATVSGHGDGSDVLRVRA